MEYRSLTIKNFRGIERLEITDLKKVNLLVGRNQCGKTSILEAIFLLSGMSNPRLPFNIHQLRDLLLTDDEDFCYMFRNLDFGNSISIEGDLGDKSRSLFVAPRYADSEELLRDSSGQEASSEPQDRLASTAAPVRSVDGLLFGFSDSRGVKFETFCSLRRNETRLVGEYKEQLRCMYLNPNSIFAQLDTKVGELIIRKKLKKIIEVLRQIDPRVEDIRLGTGGMIYVDLGLEKLIPINVMGDGIRRILGMLACMPEVKNGLLLVDEVDTGFHHTSLPVAWKALFAASKEYNVQIVATTHSYECIEAFSKTHDEIEPKDDNVRLFRIGKEDDAHQAFPFDTQVLRAGVEDGFEVR